MLGGRARLRTSRTEPVSTVQLTSTRLSLTWASLAAPLPVANLHCSTSGGGSRILRAALSSQMSAASGASGAGEAADGHLAGERNGKKTKGVDNTARRTWDKETWAKKEKEREEQALRNEHDEEKRKASRVAIFRENLKLTGSRAEGKLDLAANVGKTMVVMGPDGPKNKQAGWFCDICDCVLKDSATYLDHINGKKHQRALGMNMRVGRSTLPEVQAKLVPGRIQKAAYKPTRQDAEAELEARLEAQLAKEEDAVRLRREKRKKKKAEEEAASKAAQDEITGGGDDEM